ncbi:MAG: hypothetical protein NTY38_12890 [Acidobacteria bacterium]|nr:hypothetical protein [Acidobacteriota bacterium]
MRRTSELARLVSIGLMANLARIPLYWLVGQIDPRVAVHPARPGWFLEMTVFLFFAGVAHHLVGLATENRLVSGILATVGAAASGANAYLVFTYLAGLQLSSRPPLDDYHRFLFLFDTGFQCLMVILCITLVVLAISQPSQIEYELRRIRATRQAGTRP